MRIVEGETMEKLKDLNVTLQSVENALLKRKVSRQDQALLPDTDDDDDEDVDDDEQDLAGTDDADDADDDECGCDDETDDE